MRWFRYLMRKLRGVADAPTSSMAEDDPARDDFVARHGLSYGLPPDPVSYNGKVEAARTIKAPRGRFR